MYGKLVLVALMLSPVAIASASPASKPLQEGKPFPEQRDQIIADLDSGKIYNEIKPAERAKVLDALRRIDLVLDPERSNRVTEPDRLQAFNDQELVNEILTQAKDDSRLICRRERPVGSNRPQNICISVAQRREARENGVDTMRSIVPAQQPATN